MCNIYIIGLKSIGESWDQPTNYYHINILSTIHLLDAVIEHPLCNTIVFSSSATVYGDPLILPVPESARIDPSSPYGRSKAFAEDIIRDVCARYI